MRSEEELLKEIERINKEEVFIKSEYKTTYRKPYGTIISVLEWVLNEQKEG